MIRLLFTSGRGPAECRIAVAHALRRLAREAATLDCGCTIAEQHADQHGPACAIVVLDGEPAPALAARWTSGTVLWVCKSPLRPNHGRKNWFIGVVTLPAPEALGVPAHADIRFESFRAGGPGGQHQNTTESAVRAVHALTGLTAIARDGRSQHRNKALALRRLEALLDAQARLVRDGEERLIQAAHHGVERGSGGLRFEGPDFEPAGR
ncbi:MULTISPECIES: peptide chain release factor H [unclassified Bradyrhizobium]|uniref:peptide chain release factor H n=1 Tax=unclassified Bradyrhizobium TaxID=2631580 RepID=UPI0028E57B32|nr:MULTISPECIES: peptide chain release factor H [unclassified Bradyrhizobium]